MRGSRHESYLSPDRLLESVDEPADSATTFHVVSHLSLHLKVQEPPVLLPVFLLDDCLSNHRTRSTEGIEVTALTDARGVLGIIALLLVPVNLLPVEVLV